MRETKGISYGQPSNDIVEGMSQKHSLPAPKNKANTEILALWIIQGFDPKQSRWGKLFSQTWEKEMSMAKSKKAY